MYLTLTAEWFNRICQHLRKWKSFFWRGVRVLGGSLRMESSMISCPDVNNWRRARLTSQTSISPPPPSATHSNTVTTLHSWVFMWKDETNVYRVVTNTRAVTKETVGYFSGWPCDCFSPPVPPCRSAWSLSAFFLRLISDSPADTLQSRKWEAREKWQLQGDSYGYTERHVQASFTGSSGACVLL